MSATHEERTDRTVQKVHLAPLWSVVAGVAGLALIDRLSALSAAGWCAGLLYLGVSNALLARGLRRSAAARFGPANATTAVRSTLVGLVTAMVVTSFSAAVSVPLLLALAVPALALDAVDGWIARRTHTTSEVGARFDMEVDAFLLLVLSAYLVPQLGWWVLIIGMLRYAFVAVGWMLPWMLATLPPRYWRKVVTAVAGIALAVAASQLMPWWVDYAVTLLALALLIESFGRDVIWLALEHRDAPRLEPESSRPIEGQAHPQS
jgi:phosphatidylglycerophosphate synthase